MLFAFLLLQADPVAAFDTELKTANSATAVLQKRCAVPIRAAVDRDAQKPASTEIRARLGIPASEPVQYRSVKLMCGGTIFSHAENWYVPSRLTPAMNTQLLSTDTPFGKVIAELAPTRRTLSTEHPAAGGGVLRHNAVVIGSADRPLAAVIETYSEEAAAAK